MTEEGFEIDYRVPLALSGKHCLRNIQILTPEQHLIKHQIDLGLISQVKSGKLSLEAALRYTSNPA